MAKQDSIPLRRVLLFCALGMTGCLVDLVTKELVFRHSQLFRGSEWWLWEGHIGIQKSLNEGALFGFGQGNVGLFALFSIAAAVAIPIWLFFFRAAVDRWLTVAMGLVIGGVLGNLYDRLGFSGLDWGTFDPSRSGERVYAVRDWMLLQWNDQWVWPNFNVADSLLVAGACILLVHAFFLTPTSSSRDTEHSA